MIYKYKPLKYLVGSLQYGLPISTLFLLGLLTDRGSLLHTLGVIAIMFVLILSLLLFIHLANMTAGYKFDEKGALSATYSYGRKWTDPVLPEEIVFTLDFNAGGKVATNRLVYIGKTGSKLSYGPAMRAYPEEIRNNKDKYRAIDIANNFLSTNNEFLSAYQEFVSKIPVK